MLSTSIVVYGGMEGRHDYKLGVKKVVDGATQVGVALCTCGMLRTHMMRLKVELSAPQRASPAW